MALAEVIQRTGKDGVCSTFPATFPTMLNYRTNLLTDKDNEATKAIGANGVSPPLATALLRDILYGRLGAAVLPSPPPPGIRPTSARGRAPAAHT